MNSPGRVTLLELLLALGLPLLLLVLSTWLLEQRHNHLPSWLRAISSRKAFVWNVGMALLITAGAIRYAIKY